MGTAKNEIKKTFVYFDKGFIEADYLPTGLYSMQSLCLT